MSSVRHRLVARAAAGVAGLLLAAVVEAQPAPTRTLGKPLVELAEPFSRVGDVRELGDGRVVVLDARDAVLQFVDLARGTIDQIGRTGDGPNEYRRPQRLLPMPADTTFVPDIGNQRILVVGPTGSPAGVLSESPTTAIPGIGPQPRASDRDGHLYYLGRATAQTPQGLVMLDTAAIVRVDRRTRRADTLAFAKQPKTDIIVRGPAANPTSVEIRRPPIAPQDEWVVTPGGALAIVRVADYRVDWVASTGARRAGVPISYPRVRVTDAEKEAHLGGGARATGPARVAAMNNGLWPEYLPPFLSGNVLAAPDERVWVRRTAPAAETTITYDVFDASPRVVLRVAMPVKERVVGFGAGTVYTVRIDDDDLEYLRRYPIPR